MKLVITDTGIIWNKYNEYLKEFKSIVLIVCLNGKKVSDEYDCFVSPYKDTSEILNTNGPLEDPRLSALASVAGSLEAEFNYHDDNVFLTDCEPSTLYPYYVVKDISEYKNFHLVAVPPLNFELNSKINRYRELLSDMSELTSVLIYDSNNKLTIGDINTNLDDFYKEVKEELGGLMPCILNGIHKTKEGRYYFDFSSMKYNLLKDGFKSVDASNSKKIPKKINFSIMPTYELLGHVTMPSYPMEGESIKKTIERPEARLDGKKICNVLREQRILLAKANNITFESEECPSIGPCAGTCEKCDKEAAFLMAEMSKINEKLRVYPKFNPEKEVTL